MIYRCDLHGTDIRPQICINFPTGAGELRKLPDCGYSFTPEGKRKGKCNQCGICCMTPYITPPGYDRKFRDEPCPYLKVEDGD